MAAGYKDFVAGTVLAAADLEDYCELQSVMRFASAAARDTALSAVKTEGMLAYLLDVNTLTVYSGTAWSTIGPVHGAPTSYTPTWTGITLGSSTQVAEYVRIGRAVFFKVQLTLNTATVTTPVTFSLPVTGTELLHFNAYLIDTAGAVNYTGYAVMTSTTVCTLKAVDTAHLSGYAKDASVSNTVPKAAGWATNDVWKISGMYIASADA